MKKVILFLLASSCLIVACNSDKKEDSAEKKETMSSDSKESMTSADNKAAKNRQTALESVQAFNAHDLEAMFKNVTTDGVDYGDGSMSPVKNIDTIKAGIKAWMAAFPDVKGENLMALSDADGSHVVVIGEWTGTFKNDFMGMKATGKSFKYSDGDLFTFNDEGKITSHKSIQSSMTPMMQVGAKMGK
jgi:predicted ester cyclase